MLCVHKFQKMHQYYGNINIICKRWLTYFKVCSSKWNFISLTRNVPFTKYSIVSCTGRMNMGFPWTWTDNDTIWSEFSDAGWTRTLMDTERKKLVHTTYWVQSIYCYIFCEWDLVFGQAGRLTSLILRSIRVSL